MTGRCDVEVLKALAQAGDVDKLAHHVVEWLKEESPIKAEMNKPGAIFYSGRSTLKQGPIYLMGLNPGGDPKGTINCDLTAWMNGKANFSGYCDEPWSTDKKKYEEGEAPHQQRVKKLCKILCAKQEMLDQEEASDNEKVRNVFSANAIFVRTRKASNLMDVPEYCEIRERCWEVHKLFLQIVKPKLIVCLGNGQRLSSFSLLKDRLKVSKVSYCGNGKSFLDGRWFESEELECKVVGVPHPSRFGISVTLEQFLKETGKELQLGNKASHDPR